METMIDIEETDPGRLRPDLCRTCGAPAERRIALCALHVAAQARARVYAAENFTRGAPYRRRLTRITL